MTQADGAVRTDLAEPARPAGAPHDQRPPARRLLDRVGALAPALVLLAFLVYAVRAGLPASSAARSLAAVAVTQVLPGALLWRCLRPVRGWWWEDVAAGFALGTGLAVAAQVVAGLTGLSWLSPALTLAVGATVVAVPRSRARLRRAQAVPLPWWFGPSVAATALLAAQRLQSYYAEVPLTWASGFRTPHVDTYLHLSLSAELLHRGPLRFPWVQSEELGYHWFSHAWVAHVSASSGTALDEVLLRFMPALMPVLVVLAVALTAVRLSGRAWTGPVAALLTMAGGNADVLGASVDAAVVSAVPIAPLSPSLALAIPALVVLVVLIALRWRGEVQRGPASLAAVVLLSVTSAGTKGSTLPLVLAGLALAAAALLLLDRSRLRPVLVDLAVVTGCLAGALVVVFRGSGAGLALDLPGAAAQSPAVTWLADVERPSVQLLAAVVTVGGILSRGALSLALLSSRSSRADPVTALLLGGGLAAAGSVAVFAHPGRSQYYFALTGQPLLAVASALGLAVVVERLGLRRAAPVLLGGALLGVALALVPPAVLGPAAQDPGAGTVLRLLAVAGLLVALAAVGGWLLAGRRWRPVAAGLAMAVVTTGAVGVVATTATYEAVPSIRPVAPSKPLAVSRAQIEAARWVRDNSDPDDLVMTNRHCVGTGEPVRCDSRRFVVAAFTERQVLLEGWTATPMSAKLGPRGRDSITVDYWDQDLLRLNDGFIAAPDAAAADRLRALGVRWVLADATRPRAATLEPHATLRFRTQDVDVYEL